TNATVTLKGADAKASAELCSPRGASACDARLTDWGSSSLDSCRLSSCRPWTSLNGWPFAWPYSPSWSFSWPCSLESSPVADAAWRQLQDQRRCSPKPRLHHSMLQPADGGSTRNPVPCCCSAELSAQQRHPPP